MAKILIGIATVVACFLVADSLKCNKCLLSISGFCGTALIASEETCSTNTSVCETRQLTFSDITSFKGFSTQGCTESSTCSNNSVTTTGTIPVINMQYNVNTTCCSTDKCNPVDLTGGATYNSMSLSVVLSAAALVAVWGSYM